MLKRYFAMSCALVFGLCAGCNRNQAASVPPVSPQNPPINTEHPVEKPQIQAVSDTSIKDAITKLLADQEASEHPSIPRGTKLLNVSIDRDTATLDFSKEFNKLADSGDTTESHAQKAICAALAPIHGVQKMRVTVEGKPFESQATDWGSVMISEPETGTSAPFGAPGGSP